MISAALVMPNVVTSYLLDSLCIDMIKLLMSGCSFKDSRYATIVVTLTITWLTTDRRVVLQLFC